MIIDLHNHTTLCNHAEGTMEAYVQRAIHNKIKYYGFSEHAYMPFDEGYRIPKEKMVWYEEELQRLKELYADHITILSGYEVDYLPHKMDPEVLLRPVDYFIGSVHFLEEWGFDNPEFIGEYEKRDIDEIWRAYFRAITEMADSGQFDIVGHFDLIKVFKFLPKNDMTPIYRKTLEAIRDNHLTLEINAAGLRKKIGEPYPSETILSMAYKMEIPITFGSDAHRPEDVGYGLETVMDMARRCGYSQCALYKKRKRHMINF